MLTAARRMRAGSPGAICPGVVSLIAAEAAQDTVDGHLLALVAHLPLAVLRPFLNCAAGNVFRRQGELGYRGLLAALTTRQWATLSPLITNVPSLPTAYELLELAAATDIGAVRLQRLERPWRRMVPACAQPEAADQRVARLPAPPSLAWETPLASLNRRYLLLPDTRQ
jgi:hypothetical protein